MTQSHFEETLVELQPVLAKRFSEDAASEAIVLALKKGPLVFTDAKKLRNYLFSSASGMKVMAKRTDGREFGKREAYAQTLDDGNYRVTNETHLDVPTVSKRPIVRRGR